VATRLSESTDHASSFAAPSS